MSPELVIAANVLLEAAKDYKRRYNQEREMEPVVLLQVTDCNHTDYGLGIFIADSWNTHLIMTKSGIKL